MPVLTLPFSMKTFFGALLSLSLLPTAIAQSPLLKEVDFESGSLIGLQVQGAHEDSVSLVTSPVRVGKYAAKTLLRASDPEVNKGQRAEFSEGKRSADIQMGKDYWYGLSIYVPEDFRPVTESDAVLFQWHTQQGGPSPVLAIRVQGKDWKITGNATEKRRTLARLPLEKGRWTDWVVHVKWSEKEDGFWTIWKDGAEVVKETGIVTHYPEPIGPYAKFGQYHSVSKEVPQNVVYFDEYRVAGPGGTYERVAPAGGKPSSP